MSRPMRDNAGVRDDLEAGRRAYARRAWRDAHDALSRADEATPLDPEDLELLGTAAYMLGRDDGWVACLERAHLAHLETGDEPRAARCALWVGMHHAARGEMGPAGGWLGRAQRILERVDGEVAEHGYLLVPLAFQLEAEGDLVGAAATTGRAAEIGERFGDADLYALATHQQGQFLVIQGAVVDGFRLLDEAMVAVTAGTTSPIVTGLVYCGVILACVETFDVRRAQEWTDVLTRWCDEQPDLVAFTGRCLVHRAELLQLRGAWPDALEQARIAAERLVQGFNRAAAAQAFYRQGEVHRLRGELDAAETAYRESSRFGWEPQPGLALLRLAQGRQPAAAAATRRALGEATLWPQRAALLPGHVEIALAGGDVEEARAACAELETLAADHSATVLAAHAATARAAVHLAAGEPDQALASARRACTAWRELDAPYEEACARVAIGVACSELGDEDSAALELDAARDAFAALGATPDAERLAAYRARGRPSEAHGLTAREIEVLRLAAAGKSNRAIAAELVISEHTVARHLQNIFGKLDVSSRTAASAFGHTHGLL